MPVAVIADIVGSRRLVDRATAQRAVEAALAAADADVPAAIEPFHATVGDEFQAVHPDLSAALRVVLLVQLALPDGVGLRFGLGVGDIRPFASSAGALSDGPGWWAARDAIDAVHRMQRRAVPAARTRVVGGGDQDGGVTADIALANALALARDELVGAMTARTRRLVRGRCTGRTQRQLAEAEGITQSAVSQALAAAGAPTVVAGFQALGGAPSAAAAGRHPLFAAPRATPAERPSPHSAAPHTAPGRS